MTVLATKRKKANFKKSENFHFKKHPFNTFDLTVITQMRLRAVKCKNEP